MKHSSPANQMRKMRSHEMNLGSYYKLDHKIFIITRQLKMSSKNNFTRDNIDIYYQAFTSPPLNFNIAIFPGTKCKQMNNKNKAVSWFGWCGPWTITPKRITSSSQRRSRVRTGVNFCGNQCTAPPTILFHLCSHRQALVRCFSIFASLLLFVRFFLWLVAMQHSHIRWINWK